MVNQLKPPTFVVESVVADSASGALAVKKTVNNGVAYTDYTSAAKDDQTSTLITLSGLDTAANGDWLVIGHSVPFNSAVVVVVAANSNASVLTVEYWNGTAWTDASGTDGTISAGATFGQSGTISWTIPSAWVKNTIDGVEAYYVRLSVSAALDASTTLSSLLITQVKALADWRVKITSINWVQANASGDQCVVTDRFGRVIFDVKASEQYDFEAVYAMGWIEGLRVPVLASGKLLINVE